MVMTNLFAMEPISVADRSRINKAIHQAEAETGGEIYVVLARESDDYFYPACFMWSFIALISAICVAFWLHFSWRDVSLHYFGLDVLVCYIVGLLYLLMMPSLRLWLTPRRVKLMRAHGNAVRQFLAHNVHKTKNRTGILIFVSLAEHYAEVIADTGINDKVSQDDWRAIVDLLTSHARNGVLVEGYIQAIGKAGEILAANFPRPSDDENELPDHLVEI